MQPSFFLIHYAGRNCLAPFGVVVFADDEVHWRFRDDVDQLVDDPIDREILAGTSETFGRMVQTMGPREFVNWMSTTLSLTLRLTGPYSCESSVSEIDDALVDSVYAQHVGSSQKSGQTTP